MIKILGNLEESIGVEWKVGTIERRKRKEEEKRKIEGEFVGGEGCDARVAYRVALVGGSSGKQLFSLFISRQEISLTRSELVPAFPTLCISSSRTLQKRAATSLKGAFTWELVRWKYPVSNIRLSASRFLPNLFFQQLPTAHLCQPGSYGKLI